MTNSNLTPAALRAVNWAQTLPASVNVTQHEDFADYFGSLSDADLTAATDELERRASNYRAEAEEIEAYVEGRSPGPIARSIGYDANWSKEQFIEAAAPLSPEDRAALVAELRTSAAADSAEADALEREALIDFKPAINFLRHLSGRLQSEIDAHKQLGFLEDPNDATEIVSVDMGIGNWLLAIENLDVIASLLGALDEPSPEACIDGVDTAALAK